MLLHFVQYAALRHHQEGVARRVDGIFQQCGRRTHHISQFHHRAAAFGVHQHFGSGVLLFKLHEFRHRETLVHMAAAVPEHHLASRLRIDVVAQVIVRTEDELGVLGESFDNLFGVARRHHHISQRLDGRRGVNIRHHLVAGVRLYKVGKLVCRTAFGQRACGIEVGHEHLFLRTENFVSLAHKVHTAHHNDVGISFSRLLGQSEAVAHKVGNILQHALGVVVCQNDGIFLLAHASNFGLEVNALRHGLVNIALRFPAIFNLCHCPCVIFCVQN